MRASAWGPGTARRLTARWAVAFVVSAAVTVGFGLLLMHVLIPAGIGDLDEQVARWFVVRRTPSLDAATRVGSTLGSTPVIVIVALAASVALARRDRWDLASLLAFALTLELAVLLSATFLVDRERPMVPRLDATPATASYPSGHTAASVALYGGLALVAWSLPTSRPTRWLASLGATALVIGVGISRTYRGMHHPSDVLAGIAIGIAALWAGWYATRDVRDQAGDT